MNGDNMKREKSKKRKIAEIVLCGVCAFICAFCVANIYTNMKKDIAEWKAQTWFVFSNDPDSFNEATYMTEDELKGYKTKTDIYNSGYYYSKLSEKEKTVYNAYQYALDNNFVYTYVDDTMVTGKYKAMDILVFLSLDSATIQQNVSSVEYTCDHTIATEMYWQEITKDASGCLVSADTFSKDKVEKVNKAVEKLKKVDLKFTDKTTDKEKAEKIFDYINKKVKYSEKYTKNKDGSNIHDYLYDAVFKNSTNCDGFANMYSVLCALNGVECFEKVYTPTDEKTQGHTWNVVNIDGKWYNVDCTESVDEKPSEYKISRRMRCGFSDKLQNYTPDYKELLPECKDNIVPVKKFFKSCKDKDAASFISSQIKKSKDKYVIVAIERYKEKDLNKLMSKVANKLWSSIYVVTLENGKYTLCYFYKK